MATKGPDITDVAQTQALLDIISKTQADPAFRGINRAARAGLAELNKSIEDTYNAEVDAANKKAAEEQAAADKAARDAKRKAEDEAEKAAEAARRGEEKAATKEEASHARQR